MVLAFILVISNHIIMLKREKLTQGMVLNKKCQAVVVSSEIFSLLEVKTARDSEGLIPKLPC